MEMIGTAEFSEDKRYRYSLTRELEQPILTGDDAVILFVMLNPSTATAIVNDPTVAKCMKFGVRWGFSKLVVCNLFALRATDPQALYVVDDPVGPLNDAKIAEQAASADLIVAAWGNHGGLQRRGDHIRSLLSLFSADTFCLSVNKNGEPKHPLYVRDDAEPIKLEAR